MNKALEQAHKAREGSAQKLDWRRKISDHVAFGLLIYTGLHIFFTMTQLKSTSGSLLPYFALVVLVAAIIPACRWFEMRWDSLSDAEAADPALAPAFRREVVLLWLAAIGLPLVLTFGFKAVASLF
ncbi:hypothetical protein [Aurantiacibacter zhengii]|uniref:Uncharacterized protein n=1 Tax=Aurantiacibacter zhengii TaxID=2307003 RepID=A0A418NTG8_9SPHN|nr:hypothetical protein [Aurantiacibacter zhengii]RIV86935.1 hypothetical protein D2V07_08620 [Aurantiacibacter zhengii]